MSTTRSSAISYVIFRLDIGGEDSLLLLQHAKWGDWSLVGGHIEAGEQPVDAAIRETEEELPPLRAGEDFAVSPTPFAHLSWGPVESISAGRTPTTYSAWFFCAEFLKPPPEVLRDVERDSLAVVPLAQLAAEKWPHGLTDVLARLVRSSADLQHIPMAWPGSVARGLVPAFAATAAVSNLRARAQ